MSRADNLINGLLVQTSAKVVYYNPTKEQSRGGLKKGYVWVVVNINGNAMIFQNLYKNSRDLLVVQTEQQIRGNKEVAEACKKLGYNINWDEQESARTYVLINMRNPEVKPEHHVYK